MNYNSKVNSKIFVISFQEDMPNAKMYKKLQLMQQNCKSTKIFLLQFLVMKDSFDKQFSRIKSKPATLLRDNLYYAILLHLTKSNKNQVKIIISLENI